MSPETRMHLLRLRILRTATWIFALGLGTALSGAAEAKEVIHTIGSGQRLGSIAKRYGVSIEAICKVNGIERTEKIQPGQKLVIPDRKAKPEELGLSPLSEKAKAEKAKAERAKAEEQAKTVARAKGGPPALAKATAAAPKKLPPKEPSLHVVEKGQTLSGLALKNGTTVSAICTASGIARDGNLRMGQRILIPHRTDNDGEYAKKLRIAGEYDLNPPRIQTRASGAAGPWKKYSYAPKKPGYLSLYHYGRKWQGYVIGKRGVVLPAAKKNINWVLGATTSGPAIDQRLLLLLAHVSDYFGGRTIRIVSGYRTTSWVAASKHKEGRAVDFSIPGVPNEILRDYLRTLRHVGVGYYPNSSFIHLDVRGYNAYWIDYAGPGERPKHSKNARPPVDAHAHEDGDHEAAETERHEPNEQAEEAKDQDARPDDLPEEVKELVPTPVDEPRPRRPSAVEERAPASDGAPVPSTGNSADASATAEP